MITCYLDTQDYSTLTDSKVENKNTRELKSALLSLSKSKQVHFLFSTVCISETVPLTAESANIAERKAEFLSDLCGANALVPLERLIEKECQSIASKEILFHDMLDPNGYWFSEIPVDENAGEIWAYFKRNAEKELAQRGLNREQRSKALFPLFQNNKPTKRMFDLIDQFDASPYIEELEKKYPMKPESRDVVVRYAFGKANEREFTEALNNSLKDPRWMMKWFASEHSLSSPISEIVRKPGRELGSAIRSMIQLMNSRIQSIDLQHGGANPTSAGGEITKFWKENENDLLVTVASNSAKKAGIELSEIQSKDVDDFAPGLSTGIRSLFSSAWENIGGSRKEEPTDSQPVDAMHAIYAPYVSVFRADRFMTPHIQKQVRRFGTTVVPRLAGLLEELDSKLH
ncbi:hypothetical protein [Comamonas sp. 4034]|uniref:hypothetical protein n=1 Tax=Comamonas sp. 4034 TaxID=3156455 RepID=UPI003D24D6C5